MDGKLQLLPPRPGNARRSHSQHGHLHAPMHINAEVLIITHTFAVDLNSGGGVQRFCWFSESEGDGERL